MTFPIKSLQSLKDLSAIALLSKYYLDTKDTRSFCVAFSGGKDSTAVLYLVMQMLIELKENDYILHKKVYIINSNTLAELPPVLEHLQNTLLKIEQYSKKHNLPVIVEEVTPEVKHTLNVQLLGVGMPPPNSSLRWCTDKLKVMPIDARLKEIFPDGAFISVIGTRSDESSSRAERMERSSVKGTDLKLNNRYKNASNLMPIENWTTKDVWEYLFRQSNELVDIDFLWKLYSDASSQDASECTFVGAGGKYIDDGKLGCGTSRFGCWQCYMVRDKDRSLDGLLQSGYESIELYKEYRDWFWKKTQEGWEKTRDVYSHNHQTRAFYNKGGEDNPKFGMTMPKGLTLKLRQEAFEKLLILQNKIQETLLTKDEIILIQQRWIYEGDFELKAFRLARKYDIDLKYANLPKKVKDELKRAKNLYCGKLMTKELKSIYSTITLKRFAIQYISNPKNYNRKFFPSKKEEKFIRKEWSNQSKSKKEFSDLDSGYLIQYIRGRE
jgi:DNA sulfur modification protein DndC